MKKRAFGELELAVYRQVQAQGKATVRSVLDGLGGEDSYTTILTVLQRLFEKGELKREKRGKLYLYFPSKQQHVPALSLLERLKSRIFGGRAAAMVNYLLESNENFSEEELSEMEELVARARKQRESL